MAGLRGVVPVLMLTVNTVNLTVCCMWNAHRTLDTDLAGLVRAVATILAALDVEVSDERIRDVPNARVLRYYQSNGLIGRPLRYDGRRARYGFGHLVQAVAVKVLQREGLSLAQVQEALAGRSADEIAVLIEYASGGGGRGGDIAGEARPAASATEPDSSAPAAPGMPAPAPARLRSVWQVELARGVTVVIDPAEVSDPESVVAALSAVLLRGGV